MNKVIVCLLVAVALLGMALVMLNQQLTPQNPAPAGSPAQPVTTRLPDLPDIPGGRKNDTPASENTYPRKDLPPLPDNVGTPASEHRAPVSTATVTPTENTENPETPEADNRAETEPVKPAASVQPEAVSPAQPAETAPRKETAARQEPVRQEPKEKQEPKTIQHDPAKAPVHAKDAQTEKQKAEAQKAEARKAEAQKAEARQAEQKKADQKKNDAARSDKTAQTEKQEKARDKADAAARKKSGKVTVFTRENGATVRLSGSEDIDCKHLVLKQPDRVVLDLQGNWDVSTTGIPKNVLVTNIRLGRFPNRTRVVIDMQSSPKSTKVNLSGNKRQLDVRVDK